MIAYACALQEREKSGIPSGDFFGVPVFQVLLSRYFSLDMSLTMF